MTKEKNEKMIGYVSIPFGTKYDVDFKKIYMEAVFPSTNTATKSEPKEVYLFREDGDIPQLQYKHEQRLEKLGFNSHPAETRLRDEIQRHIVLADFIIADISYSNPNVMLEVGYAQAIGKRIIYLTHTHANTPSNLGDLKRFIVYNLDNLDELKINIYLKTNEVISEIELYEKILKVHGGQIDYFPERQKMPLDEKLENASDIIQILTTNLTTVSANYRESILKAMNNAEKNGKEFEVTILTSDPESPFIQPRANQLNEDSAGYQSELVGSLKSVASKLLEKTGCKILTYSDFPVQSWHRIDKTIYIGSPSVLRRSRQNCVFAIPVDVPGIKETFLDHFDKLKENAIPLDPKSYNRK